MPDPIADQVLDILDAHGRRTRLSVRPMRRRISGGTLACVIDAGCPIKLSTPPTIRQREDLGALHEPPGERGVTQLDASASRRIPHLPPGELVLRMRAQSG